MTVRFKKNNKNAVIDDFKGKSKYYYERIYLEGKDPKRISRLKETDNFLKNFDLNNKTVLDAGSGPAVLYDLINKHKGIYYAIDISPDNIKSAKKRIPGLNATVGSVDNTGFTNDKFDFIISLGCIEYIKDAEKVMSEFKRILKPGGIMVISFANLYCSSRLWDETIIRPLIIIKKKIKKLPYYRRYLHSLNFVSQILKENGLALSEIRFINFSIAGYPFSSLELIRIMELRILSLFKSLNRFSSEFLVIGRKEQ